MSEPFEALGDNPLRFEDERGWLEVLHESGSCVLKRSFSRAGVFRGLHYQPGPNRQTKLIRVVDGRILDFVADVESAAPALHHKELAPADGWVRIAADLAHGFYALEDTTFEYVCGGAYDEGSEQAFCILPQLFELGIVNPILSVKDRASPPLFAEAA